MKRTEVLNLGKHFTIIDSPVPFYLIDNYGFRAYRPAGAWQFDNWKLLPEKSHKIYPVYTLSIEWESGINDDQNPQFTETDLDLGDGIAGVNGQPVNITSDVGVKVKSPLVQVGEQEAVAVHLETNLQPIEVVSHGNNLVDSYEVYLGSFYSTSALDEWLESFPDGLYYLKSFRIYSSAKNGTFDYSKYENWKDCLMEVSNGVFSVGCLKESDEHTFASSDYVGSNLFEVFLVCKKVE